MFEEVRSHGRVYHVVTGLSIDIFAARSELKWLGLLRRDFVWDSNGGVVRGSRDARSMVDGWAFKVGIAGRSKLRPYKGLGTVNVVAV